MEEEVPADLSLGESEPAALRFPVQVGRLHRCTAFVAEARPQGEYFIQVIGAYPPDEDGQLARAEQIRRSEGWRPLYHCCAEEMCLATLRASRGTLIAVSELEEVDAAEASEFYLECHAVDPWARWSQELGPEPAGEAAACRSSEVELDGFGMPLEGCAVQDTAAPTSGPRPMVAPARGGGRQPAALQASPLEEAGARPSAVAPPARETGPTRGARPRCQQKRRQVPRAAALGRGPRDLFSSCCLRRRPTGAALVTYCSQFSVAPAPVVMGQSREVAPFVEALAKMSEYVTTQDGEKAGEDFPSIFMKYFLNVPVPQTPIKSIGMEVYREMRTGCEAADAIPSGKTAYAIDVLGPRFKALQLSAIDKCWSGARRLELIPSMNEQLALRTEDEEIVRAVELGDLRLEELLPELRQGWET
ncbi:unnamed protein product, partial [Prorocentrum cordatum]